MYRFSLRIALPVLVITGLTVLATAIFATTTPSISISIAGEHSGSSISTISGSGGSGEMISLYSGSMLLGTGLIDTLGSFDIGITPAIDNTTIDLTPVADDGSGTIATWSTITITHDNIAPTAVVTYSQTGITNQNVIATLTGSSETITVTSTGGPTHTFTTNGSFVFTFIDTVGNTGSTTATVTNIDTTAPVVVIVGSGTQTLEAFSGTYSDAGATYSDAVDGTGTISVASSGVISVKTPATYTLTYSKTDTAGNTGSISRSVTIVDTTPPIATLVWPTTQTLEATNGTYSDSGATWTDIVDGTGTITTASSGTVNMKVPGVYTLEYKKVDAVGNTSNTVTRSVTIVDTTTPTVMLAGAATITIQAGSSFSEPGATWTDIVDGSGSLATSSSGTVNNVLPGTYTLVYKYTDTHGNSGSANRTIVIIDTIAPVVHLNGAPLLTFEASTGAFIDPGASYTDTVIGLGTIPTYNSGSLNMRIPGTYTIAYLQSDGSNTGSITRSVTIVDTTPPIATLVWPTTQTLEATNGTYSDSGATWTDIVDGTGTIITASSGTVNMKVPGVYTLIYQRTDGAGNISNTITRTVTIVDTTPPIATLVWPTTQTLEATNGTYSDSGATWTDIVDGTGIISVASSGTVNMKVPGVYTLSYTQVDAHGNTGSILRQVTIQDTTAPSLTMLGSGTLTIAHNSVWSDPGVTYTDIVIGTGVIIVPFSGSVNTSLVGTYMLQYKKTDTTGNTSSILTRTVYVTDQTAPSIVLNNSAITAYIGTTFTDLGATWSDAVDGTGIVFAYSGVVNTNVLGTYTLAYKKVDAAGNASPIITHTVSIILPPGSGGGGWGGGGSSSYIPSTTPASTTVVNTGSTATGITATGVVATGSIVLVRQIPPVRKVIIRPKVQIASGTYLTSEKTHTIAPPTPITVSQKISRSLVVNTVRTGIFATPATTWRFLGYLVRGDTITVTAEKDGWVQFTVNSITGWSKLSAFSPSTDTPILTPSVTQATSPVIEKNKIFYYTIAPRVNIRISANATAQSTRHLTGGEDVIYLRTLGSWAQIQTQDGYIGWVAARYIAHH